MTTRTSRAPSTSAASAAAALRGRWVILSSMLAAITVVTLLAWWDEQREADAAMSDLEAEQSVLAASLAADLRAHLVAAGRTNEHVFDTGITPADLLDVSEPIRHEQIVVFVAPPDGAALRGLGGNVVRSAPLEDAVARRLSTLRLSRPEAAHVSLPERTSVAGIASVDVGQGRRWSVITVTSAARERDREKRAVWRLLLGVLLASGLVIVFGGAALRRQRKQLELLRALAVAEAQRERNEELLRAERVATMGTFALGIAHEVSTPLGVIVGRAEQLLGKAQGDERRARNAQAILNQADRIQHIVRRFLDMARGRPPSMEQADPAQIVRAAVAAVEHRFARAQVRLATDIPPSMPAVQCDRDLLEHAVVNLLLNACEACEAGGHVSLTARSDAGQVGFVVVDDGAGISPEDAARAAEPFFTTKADGSGTGLGLAIATEIVKSHRGELAIGPNQSDSPQKAKGTRAIIEIPIAPVPASGAAA